MARISRAKLSERFCSAVIFCLLWDRSRVSTGTMAATSRQGLANERRDLVADQLDGSHDMPVLHADPLKSRDEPSAARRTQQVDNLFGALLGRTDMKRSLSRSSNSGCGLASPTTSVKSPNCRKSCSFPRLPGQHRGWPCSGPPQPRYFEAPGSRPESACRAPQAPP